MPAASPIEWFSFLLIRDVPPELCSIVWRSAIADMKKEFGEKQSTRMACQGYIYPAAVDFGTQYDHDSIACPTIYCRVRTDQRWHLAILPYCVPMNTRKYMGVQCRVLRVIKVKGELDRAATAEHYSKMIESHNNRSIRHTYPFDVHRIAQDYSSACGDLFGYAYSKSERPASGDELWHDLHEIRETNYFPLEIDEAAIEWKEDYDFAVRVGEKPPIGWPLPPGLVSSFYSERPYCTNEENTAIAGDLIYESMKHNDPRWMDRDEEAIYRSLQAGRSDDYMNALFIYRRPYLSDKDTFRRVFSSGHLIYEPTDSSVNILSIGVNRDERRQGYASQMVRMLARQYSMSPIEAVIDKDQLEFLAMMLSIGATINENSSSYRCSISIEDLFPVERTTLPQPKKKGKKPKKK